MLSTGPETESYAKLRRGYHVRIVAIVVGACWVASLFVVVAEDGPPDEGDTIIQPVESYTSADLRRAARELRLLRGSRLTPEERAAVGVAADVVSDLVAGRATLEPSPAPTTTAAPPSTRPPTASPTTTSTTSTTSTTTTTTPRRTRDEMVADLADQLGVDIPDGPVG